MVVQKVKYQNFLDAGKYTLDPYWVQVFDDCARGKWPKGVSIDRDGLNIYIKVGKNLTNHKLETSPEKLFILIKKLFSEKLELKSTLDNANDSTETEAISAKFQEVLDCDWYGIKQKKIKDSIVRRFILDLKENYTLDAEETKHVARWIKLGFLFNWITNDKVQYENNEIIQIDNLFYDNDTGEFDLDVEHTRIKREYIPKRSKFSALWKKQMVKNKGKY